MQIKVFRNDNMSRGSFFLTVIPTIGLYTDMIEKVFSFSLAFMFWEFIIQFEYGDENKGMD